MCFVKSPRTAPFALNSAYSSSFLPSHPSKVQVLYGGTDLFDYEVRRTFNNDMLLAFISSSCIAVLVYILTSCSGRLGAQCALLVPQQGRWEVSILPGDGHHWCIFHLAFLLQCSCHSLASPVLG